MLLLDTCALVWLVQDLSSLGEEAKTAISEDPENLHVSAISSLEITLLSEKKSIVLPTEPFKWYSDALRLHGIREVAVSGEIASLSGSLPPIHKDPCDRIIIATALTKRMRILTPDKMFRKYNGAKVVW